MKDKQNKQSINLFNQRKERNELNSGIGNNVGDFTTDTRDNAMKMLKIHTQKKLKNSEAMDKFLDTYDLQKLYV